MLGWTFITSSSFSDFIFFILYGLQAVMKNMFLGIGFMKLFSSDDMFGFWSLRFAEFVNIKVIKGLF